MAPMRLSNDAIGGYQELELPLFHDDRNYGKVLTNSARSALKIILAELCIEKIWLPLYTCDAVVDAVMEMGLNWGSYNLEPTFDVDLKFRLAKNEYILVIDYYGLCGEAVQRSLERFGCNNTIVDLSQAYFSFYKNAVAMFWSPRKFFGLPDGGVLYSGALDLKRPAITDCSSLSRMNHLISRIAHPPEMAYQSYLAAEKSISDMPVMGMSRLTERLLSSINVENAGKIRRRNAVYLHKRLSDFNRLDLNVSGGMAPLCYPLLPKVKMASRESLIQNKIFMPTYWPEVVGRSVKGGFEWDLATNGLFLPCDQRYTEDDLDRMIEVLGIC